MLLHLGNADTETPWGMKVKTGGLESTAGRLPVQWMRLQTLVPPRDEAFHLAASLNGCAFQYIISLIIIQKGLPNNSFQVFQMDWI